MSEGSSFTSSQRRGHALVIPMWLQAHVAGIYRFAISLAKKGVKVTFVSLQSEVARLESFGEFRELDISIMSLSPTYKPAKYRPGIDTVGAFSTDTQHAFEPIYENLVRDHKVGTPRPTCIVADRFLSWVKDVALELRMPYYQFFSCGAIYARILQATPTVFADGTLTVSEETKLLSKFEGTVTIPGLPPLRYHELPFGHRFTTPTTRKIAETVSEADALFVNTFYELESPSIDAIRQTWKEGADKKIRKLYLIGPLSKADSFKDRAFQSGLDNLGTACMQWLDSRPDLSVLYICLGTLSRMRPKQIYEVALALEASEQSFLWVLPEDGGNFSSLEEVLPPGFEARTREKGFIANGWVPQLQILGHSSVRGFITHCGWNSILEAVTSGVPMVAWPQTAEQHLNCRYFVDVMRIAVEMAGETSDGILIGHEEIEKAVRLLMVETEGIAMRSRVQDLKMKAKAALADGGPSSKALDEFVSCIPSAQ